MTTTETSKPRISTEEIDKSLAAAASSSKARLNIPLNIENWKKLPEDVQSELLWFHQHALDKQLTLAECSRAISYDTSTVFRILKGDYEGSWKNVCEKIVSYRRLDAERGTIQKNEFVENSMTRLIFAALNYAMANNSITMIIGESRMGKTISAKSWRDRNNHGRSVYVIAPAYGGTKALLRDIAQAVGVNKNLAAPPMHAAILRAFNRNRILIVDEAHRLLPGDRRTNPVNLEILRDIHDRTECALALLATERFDIELKKSEYMFEQLLGRIGMPVRLPRKIKTADYDGILRQYVGRPSAKVLTACDEISNRPGRLGILVETLKVASRMAAKEQKTDRPRITEEYVFKAIGLRRAMMGGLIEKG